jgi:hypothetical protein
MHLLFNELSLQHTCPTDEHFVRAVSHIMKLRTIAQKQSRNIYCHRQITTIEVAPEKSMHQAVQKLDINMKRAFMNWITTTGPFWDDERKHSPDEYFELIDSTIITDTGLGEAAYRMHIGEDSSTISVPNDPWIQHPITVQWHTSDSVIPIEIDNYCNDSQFTVALERAKTPILSWDDLHMRCVNEFDKLFFVENCNRSIQQLPFSKASAERIYELLNMLNRFVSEHDKDGVRTSTGQIYYQDWFTGKRAWFTDSSDSEQAEYENELTFTLPDGTTMLCGMHGKANSIFGPIRIHFSWPLNEDGKIYIVYIGKKITM